jgi:Tfp pilus assembly protein PilN
MIELNLLPDVKLEYIKAQRQRRLVITIAVIACVSSIALLLLLFSAGLLQKKHIKDLTNDINRESKTLQNKPQINKILTVQNQLGSLTALHNSKPAASRLFDYLNNVTPAQVSISSFDIDFAQNSATVTGTADALSSVNKFVDTLKFTTYKFDGADSEGGQKAFSNVVMSSFGLSGVQNTGQAASYSLTFLYDKNIFDVTKTVELSVPSITTTRSALEKPSDLFQAAPTTKGSQ